MKSLFAAALVGIVAQVDAAELHHKRIATAYNHHRSACNAATDLPDGISQRKKDMTTQTKYKSMLLADCDTLEDKQKKLTCIQGNVWLKTGKVNYVNYVGARLQSNTCQKLKHIPVCNTMCKEFFLFWHEPIPGSCERVKSEWKYECELRVQLIKEKSLEQWDAAKITQDKLDGLFPDLDAAYQAAAPVLHILPNPWLIKNGTYDLTDPEIKLITDQFNAVESVEEKCDLAFKWHDSKKIDLTEGYAQGDVLVKAKAWHEKREPTAAHKDEYALFLDRNARKTAALHRLAVVKCRLGNDVCYDGNDACDALTAFYRDQQLAIDRLRHVNSGQIRDYQSVVQSSEDMKKTTRMWQQRITDNREALAQYVLKVREEFDGQVEAAKVAEATREVKKQNQALWRQYLRIEAKQNVMQERLWAENERIGGLINALIAKGKAREAELIANFLI